MEITASVEQGQVPTTVLHLTGDLDANTEGQLVQHARAAVEQGAQHLVIDLTHVRYISSAGVRALHKVYLLMRPDEPAEVRLQGLRDGTYTAPNLRLLKPNDDVREVLSMTGLDMYLQIHPDLPSALASF
jgi:anti-anti-sigma factor